MISFSKPSSEYNGNAKVITLDLDDESFRNAKLDDSDVSHGKPKKIKCKRLAIHLHQMTFSGRACSQKYLQALAREPSSGYYRSFHKRHLQLQLPYPSDAHPSKKVHGWTHFDLFPLSAINLLIELLVDQKMINQTDEFPGYGNDCHIVLLLFAQPLVESGQPCIFHISYCLGSLDKYNSDILGTALCDPAFPLFAADSFSPGLRPHHFASCSGV